MQIFGQKYRGMRHFRSWGWLKCVLWKQRADWTDMHHKMVYWHSFVLRVMDLVYICMKFYLTGSFQVLFPINPFLANWNFTFHLVFVNTGVGEIVSFILLMYFSLLLVLQRVIWWDSNKRQKSSLSVVVAVHWHCMCKIKP